MTSGANTYGGISSTTYNVPMTSSISNDQKNPQTYEEFKKLTENSTLIDGLTGEVIGKSVRGATSYPITTTGTAVSSYTPSYLLGNSTHSYTPSLGTGLDADYGTHKVNTTTTYKQYSNNTNEPTY